MIEARFTIEMMNILKGLKGCKLVEISATEFYEERIVYDGTIYLRVGDGKTIKISNAPKRIPWFKHKDLSEIDEIFSFSCAETFDRGEEKIAIKETIKEIKLITDYIKIPQKNYEITLDTGLIIVTSEHRYLISRGWYFEEYLDINVDKELDDVYSVTQAVEDWNNFGLWEVFVERKTMSL